MMDSKNKVFNIFNAPRGKASAAGEEIYEWEYLDEDGKLHNDSKNVKEEINSFISRVDYKAQIKRGELETNEQLGMVSRDFTTIPGDTVDIYKYLTYLASLSKEQVANLMEQVNVRDQDSVQETQTGDQATTTGGQVDEKVTEE